MTDAAAASCSKYMLHTGVLCRWRFAENDCTLFACDDGGRGGTGRRARLRIWYPKGCGGSNPLGRNPMACSPGIDAGAPSLARMCVQWP